MNRVRRFFDRLEQLRDDAAESYRTCRDQDRPVPTVDLRKSPTPDAVGKS